MEKNILGGILGRFANIFKFQKWFENLEILVRKCIIWTENIKFGQILKNVTSPRYFLGKAPEQSQQLSGIDWPASELPQQALEVVQRS